MSLSRLWNASVLPDTNSQVKEENQLSIKCTGGQASLARIYKKRKDPCVSYQVHIEPQVTLKTNDSMKSKDSRSFSLKNSKEEDPIIFRSYNIYLISNQMQAGYEKHCRYSAIKSMKIFSFESYPIIVDSNHVLFKVEMSSVTYVDCAIRRGEYRFDNNIKYNDIPGFCAVGRIIAVASNVEDVEVGERIATILHHGGNARYAVQCSSKLIKISEHDDANDMCGLLSAYIPAFACLQQGKNETERYLEDSLSGKTIFVNGGMSIVGQAVIELSFHLGAEIVYASGKAKDFHHLKKLGGVPIHLEDTAVPNPELEKKIDVIVDCTTFDTLDYLLRMKKNSGYITYYKDGEISKTGRHGWRSTSSLFKCKVLMHYFQRVSICDPLDNFETLTNDFKFLKSFIESSNKSFKPRVVTTISLEEIPYTHFKLDMNNVKGCITVNPWE